jgi:hypothetical protein
VLGVGRFFFDLFLFLVIFAHCSRFVPRKILYQTQMSIETTRQHYSTYSCDVAIVIRIDMVEEDFLVSIAELTFMRVILLQIFGIEFTRHRFKSNILQLINAQKTTTIPQASNHVKSSTDHTIDGVFFVRPTERTRAVAMFCLVSSAAQLKDRLD